MHRIPSSIIFDIFSRVPARCLARSRCVSKIWCNYIDDQYLRIIHDKRVAEEPTPNLYHYHIALKKKTFSICFHVSEFKQVGATHVVFEPKKGPFLEFVRKRPLCTSSIRRIEARGSCNGLICLSQDDGYVITSLTVVHPLKKECYELPPFPLRFDRSMFGEFCGLGFDTSTNTWKMVCVLLKEYAPPDKPDKVKKNLCTMVYVFGTNSWREIPHVPSYPISGKAVFSNGCVHWLVSYCDMETEDGGRPVIWLDVEKEEFGLIDPPKRMCDLWRDNSCNYDKLYYINGEECVIYGTCKYDHLVDINGEVGYVCCRTMEVWVLKQKEWVSHCRFKSIIFPHGYIEVLGCWNKDGDMLIANLFARKYVFFIYNLKSGVLHNTNIAGAGLGPNIFMYPNTLSSIRGINTNSFSMRKTGAKKTCHKIYTTNLSYISK